MKRERVLKVVLVVLGLLFCAGVYPLVLMAKEEPALAMMMSLYVTLGIFLLLAARNPSANARRLSLKPCPGFLNKQVRLSKKRL